MKTLIKLLMFIALSIPLFSQNIFASEKIKIGLIVPLSGENSLIGEKIIKSIRMAINKINDERVEIIPKDTKSNPIDALKVSKELYKDGVRIIIGPVFNESTKYLDDLKDVTFISFTNKLIGNPKNVISAGVNAISQVQTIKKFNNRNNLSKSIILIPRAQFKKEIEEAINKTKIKHKEVFYYDREPTKLTKQIEELTKYQIRKNNLKFEIQRLEGLSFKDKDKKIQNLKKRDTLGNINFDSVVIADFDENLKSVATSLLYTDVSSKRVSYITLNQWFDESLLKDDSLHPIYFPSINKDNYELFMNDFKNAYGLDGDQLSFLSYDLIGLVYFLIYENDFKISKKIFYKKNKFKGKIGVFEISKNTITHQLNFYSIEDKKFKKIF
ncbi:ABC transporter substrate-binding protein [Pelagibacterales bacterium SAG-MED16]|nr:ABC transporter substrate-binding protein [Pelagibacterales bacterium SAG-MED16]